MSNKEKTQTERELPELKKIICSSEQLKKMNLNQIAALVAAEIEITLRG